MLKTGNRFVRSQILLRSFPILILSFGVLAVISDAAEIELGNLSSSGQEHTIEIDFSQPPSESPLASFALQLIFDPSEAELVGVGFAASAFASDGLGGDPLMIPNEQGAIIGGYSTSGATSSPLFSVTMRLLDTVASSTIRFEAVHSAFPDFQGFTDENCSPISAQIASPLDSIRLESQPTSGSIQGTVWNDMNKNGTIDENLLSFGLPGILVQLFDLQTNLVSEATTRLNGDNRGYYEFAEVPAGSYILAHCDPIEENIQRPSFGRFVGL